MEFKKCVRCGCFFVTDGEVCQACLPKDRLDEIKFKDYVELNPEASAHSISIDTGISSRNISRYISNSEKLPGINNL